MKNEALERPVITEFMGDGFRLDKAHKMYLNNLELWNYIQALDEYCDYIESKSCAGKPVADTSGGLHLARLQLGFENLNFYDMKIHNRKAWWNYEKEKYKRKIKQKDESLKIHIIEMDKLRNENRRLRKKLNEETVSEAKRMIDFVNCIREHPDIKIPYKAKTIVDWFINQS